MIAIIFTPSSDEYWFILLYSIYHIFLRKILSLWGQDTNLEAILLTSEPNKVTIDPPLIKIPFLISTRKTTPPPSPPRSIHRSQNPGPQKAIEILVCLSKRRVEGSARFRYEKLSMPATFSTRTGKKEGTARVRQQRRERVFRGLIKITTWEAVDRSLDFYCRDFPRRGTSRLIPPRNDPYRSIPVLPLSAPAILVRP